MKLKLHWFKELPFQKKLVAYFTASLVVLGFIFILIYKGNRYLVNTTDLVEHTNSILLLNQTILNHAQNIESSSRGYLLAGDEEYLELFDRSITALPKYIAELKEKTADNVLQQQRVMLIERLLNNDIQVRKKLIRIRREEGFEPALDLFNNKIAKRMMDSLRTASARIDAHEKKALVVREENNDSSITILSVAINLLQLLILGLLVAGFLIINNNTKKRNLAEEDLQRSKEALAKYNDELQKLLNGLQKLLEASLDVICIIDEEGRFILMSSACEKLLGYTCDELIGRRFIELVHQDDIVMTNKITAQIKAAKGVVDFENHYYRKDGTVVSVKWVATWSPEEKQMYCIARDTTEKKLTLERLRKTQDEKETVIEELVKSNADLKQFSFITSHNFRAPLSNIIGILSIIEYAELSTHNKSLFDLLKQSTGQLIKTIDDLTSILVIKNNPGGGIQDVHLQDVYKAVEKVFTYALVEADGIVVTDFQVPDVKFNAVYLESILINLISNSIQFKSPDRALCIHLESHKDEQGNTVIIVSDNGIGIDLKRHRNRVFGMYQRFHANTTGQGLGLFMIKSQINALGGQIDIQSEIGKGTTFIITLKSQPLAQVRQFNKGKAYTAVG